MFMGFSWNLLGFPWNFMGFALWISEPKWWFNDF
jgi:hypothetical protein